GDDGGAPAGARDGLSELRPLSAYDGLRQRRLSAPDAAAPGAERARARGGGDAGAGATDRARAALSPPALRRPAAARGHGARARVAPASLAHGRAARRARQEAP